MNLVRCQDRSRGVLTILCGAAFLFTAQTFASEQSEHAQILEGFQKDRPTNPDRKREMAAAVSAGFATVRGNFSYAPWPTYPKQALRNRLAGNGLLCLHLDAAGNVTQVRMLLSTGHQILDDAALAATRRWRAKPSVPRHVDIPIDFVLPDQQGLRSFVTNLPPLPRIMFGHSIPAGG